MGGRCSPPWRVAFIRRHDGPRWEHGKFSELSSSDASCRGEDGPSSSTGQPRPARPEGRDYVLGFHEPRQLPARSQVHTPTMSCTPTELELRASRLWHARRSPSLSKSCTSRTILPATIASCS